MNDNRPTLIPTSNESDDVELACMDILDRHDEIYMAPFHGYASMYVRADCPIHALLVMLDDLQASSRKLRGTIKNMKGDVISKATLERLDQLTETAQAIRRMATLL